MRKNILLLTLLSLLTIVGLSAAAYSEGADNGTEKTVAIDQTPDAVHAVLDKFAAAGSVDNIVREDEDGYIAYSSEVTIGGTTFELKLGEDASVLEVEYEDDDQPGDDDDEE